MFLLLLTWWDLLLECDVLFPLLWMDLLALSLGFMSLFCPESGGSGLLNLAMKLGWLTVLLPIGPIRGGCRRGRRFVVRYLPYAYRLLELLIMVSFASGVCARCTQVFRLDVNVMLQASCSEVCYVFVDTTSRVGQRWRLSVTMPELQWI
jgi:hypothetical protein